MAKVSKRWQAIVGKVKTGKIYAAQEGFKLVKDCATAKFPEGIDAAVELGIDSSKSDQGVRGACVLPHGTGRTVKVAVFAQGAAAEAAKAAGADVVGMDELAADMKKGNLNYNVVIAAPDAMRIVGTLGQVLGPRGLMPNPKVGTVTPDVAGAVKNAKGGQVRYRNDKGGIIHCSIGKASFETQALQENLEALLADLKKLKPSSSKGIYLKKVTISSTMGPGIVLDLSSLNV